MLRRIMTMVAVAIIGLIGAVTFTTPANASASWITICNNRISADNILAYNNSVGVSRVINQGDCSNISDAYGDARVDVDIGGSEGDVDSWHKAKDGSNYGPCYTNEDESSNPYSDYTGVKTTYRTFSSGSC